MSESFWSQRAMEARRREKLDRITAALRVLEGWTVVGVFVDDYPSGFVIDLTMGRPDPPEAGAGLTTTRDLLLKTWRLDVSDTHVELEELDTD